MDNRRSTRKQREESEEDLSLENIDPTNFCEKIKTDEDAISLAEKFRLIPVKGDTAECKCGGTLKCKTETRVPLKWLWRCSDCNSTVSPLNDTFFSDLKIPLRDCLKLILCYVADCSRKQMVKFIKRDEKTITSWCRKVRQAMIVKNSNDFTKFSGDIEIDESCICRNKYGIGSHLASQARDLWVLGFFERNTKKRFVTRVYNRTIPYMDSVMMKVLGDGCLIITDKFKTYMNFMSRNPEISSRGHQSVNHKRNFVDPEDRDVHTQHIESLWKQAKKAIKSFQSLDLIDEYLAEYQYRCNYFKDEHYSYAFNFILLLKDLASVYAPKGYEKIQKVDVIDPQLQNGFPVDVSKALEKKDRKHLNQDFFAEGEMTTQAAVKLEQRKLIDEIQDCLSDEDAPELSKSAWKEAHITKFIQSDKVVRYSKRQDLGINVYVNKDTILDVVGRNVGPNKGWLADDAVNAYMKLIKARFTREDRRIAIVSTHFFTALRAGNDDYLKYVNEDELEEATIILIPVFSGETNKSGHWYLGVVNRSEEEKEIAFYNSLPWRHSDEMKVLRTYIEKLHSSRGLPQIDEYRFRSSLSKHEVPQQRTTNDCGVFTLLFAKKIAEGAKITSKCINPSNIPSHRLDIAYELINKRIE